MMFKALLFFTLVVLAVAKEKSQCEIQNKVEAEDWAVFKADRSNPSEKMLCLFKCFYETDGTLNSEGVLDVEKLIEVTNKWKPITDATKTSIRECSKSQAPVKTCADIKPIFQCVYSGVQKQETA